jgi:MFS family permease
MAVAPLLPADRGQDGPIRWLSIFAAIASISVVGMSIGLGMPLLSVVLESRGHSATSIGLNVAVAGLASIVAAPFAAPLAARFGVAATMLAMILAGTVAYLGFFLATQYWMWFPLRFVLHFAITVLFVLSEFWITATAPQARRGFVLGVYATVLSLGFAFGPWVFAQIGSQGALPFIVACGMTLLAAPPIIAAWKESPDIRATRPSMRFSSYIFLVPTATAAVFVFGAVETGGFALFPLYGSRLGYYEAEAALLLTAVGLGNVVLQIPLGLLSDRMRDRRHLLIGCAVTGLAGMLVLPLIAESWYASAALLFVWGGVVAGLYTVGLAHLGSRLSGRDLASANAAFVLCYGVGMLVGPQMLGLGMDIFDTHGFAYVLAVFFVGYIGLAMTRLARGSRS